MAKIPGDPTGAAGRVINAATANGWRVRTGMFSWEREFLKGAQFVRIEFDRLGRIREVRTRTKHVVGPEREAQAVQLLTDSHPTINA
ncbi:hypothetical protein ACX801_07985 [Arthrobacter bambusae]